MMTDLRTFDQKYPQAATLAAAYPGQYMGPHKEIQVALDIFQSWRLAACATCGKSTGWRVDLVECPPAAICSEDCHIRFLMAAPDANDIERVSWYACEPLSKDFAARMQALVKDAKVDIDAPIVGDVDL